MYATIVTFMNKINTKSYSSIKIYYQLHQGLYEVVTELDLSFIRRIYWWFIWEKNRAAYQIESESDRDTFFFNWRGLFYAYLWV